MVDALVGSELLAEARVDEAVAVVDRTLRCGRETVAPLGVRRRMAEIAGYVGGAFVVGAAVLFFSTAWEELSRGQQVGLLLGSAAVLAAAGAGFVRSAGGRRAVRRPEEAVRRRLSSVLLTGAAGCAAFGTGLLLDDVLGPEPVVVMLAALAGTLVALAGYALAPTTVGQVGAAVGAFAMIPSGIEALPGREVSSVAVGLGTLALGGIWLAVAERGWWHERLSGRVVGCVLALVGAQLPIADSNAWVGYLLTALVAVAAFGSYVLTRSWPYLATGVVALTVVVPEALGDWFGDSLGAAGVLLAAGVTLLVAALLGLRLRQEVTHP